MSLFNNALAIAADTTNVQAGGKSFLEEAGNALTYGAGAAVLSGLGSIYNTAAAGINLVGGSVEEIDTYKTLQNLDTNWADYYKQNETAIDVVGFVGASLIPGTLAVKALNMARAGSGLGAVGRALNFTRTAQAEAAERALAELAIEGGTVFTRINKNKLAAMGWAFADQTLTAAAFETGVALTMKQSPMLADDSWWDIGKSALVGAAFGGFIGGGIDSLILNKGFKTAVKQLDSKQRGYDYIQALDEFNFAAGDKAYGIIDSLTALPTEVLAADKMLDINLRLSGKVYNKPLDVSTFLGNTLNSTKKAALLDFEIALNKLSSDTTVNQAFATHLVERFKSLQASGQSPELVRESMGDLLFGLDSLTAATKNPTVKSGDLWYFNKSMTGKLPENATLADYETALFNSTPVKDGAYAKPYVFLGTPEQQLASFQNAARIGARDGEFATLNDAWKAGKDVAFMPDGALRVNDSSALWKRVEDPLYKSTRFFNARTGALTDDTVLTAADVLAPGKKLDDAAIKADAVYLTTGTAGKTTTKVIDMKVFNATGDTEYFTARHAWASKLKDEQLPSSVDVTDFSLMDRLRTLKQADEPTSAGIMLTRKDEVIGSVNDFSISELIKSTKLAEAERLFGEAAQAGKSLDLRAVAYQLNVDARWLEGAIANGFRSSGDAAETAGKEFLELASYTQRENLVADFKLPQQFKELPTLVPDMPWRERRDIIMEAVNTTGGQFVTGELAWGQRVRDAIQVNKNASAAVLGTERVSLLPELSQDAAKQANTGGAGATMLGSANADYGNTLAVNVQTSGKLVNKWIQEDTKLVVDAFTSPALKLKAKPEAATELGLITNILRGTDEKYVVSAVTPKQLILRELAKFETDPVKYAEALNTAKGNGKRTTIDFEFDESFDFFATHLKLNGDRVDRRTVLNNAKGFVSNIEPTTAYVPPIDTTYFQHFAFVRPVEGKAFSTSEVSMVFGRNAEELSQRIASIDKTLFDVTSKKETEKFFKAKELYDFNLTMNEPRINSELRKSGALSSAFPEVRADNLVEDYMRWHQNQTGRLVRDSVETHYAQQFAELKKLGETYSNLATSKFSGTSTKSATEIVNPYDDYRKTALDISKRSEYQFLHQANEFVDALGTRAYQALSGLMSDASKQKGLSTYTEVNAQMEKLGIKGVYNSQEELFTANVPRDRNVVREYVSKANAFLANTVLRLDFFNGIVNTISTPLMISTELASIRSLAKSDPALLGKLAELMSVEAPNGMRVPSTTKLIGQATANMMGPRREELLARYMANGDVTDALQQHQQVMSSLALRADFKVFSDGVNNAFEKAASLTGNNLAEQSTRFITADVMRQLTDPLLEAGKLSLKEQNAFISVFTNRVQGNYITSQRPIVFQGVLGSAVSLFQTYSFNLMQQLLRHVENGDKRAVATMFGMQAGTFGLSGTPFFEAVNTHIIGNAAINQGHYDAYSIVPQVMGKKAGDWLMYGTASAMPAFFGASGWPALYTRGDVNPRHMTILPINPLDIPAIDVSSKIISNLMDVGGKLVKGADISETLLQGLEHNGVNRPLAGLAQVLNGKSTTSKGSLISASNDWNMIASASRIMGAKPMDEAVALNNLYRMKAYQTADMDRQEQLGERVKSYLYRNEFPPDDVIDQFSKDYAKAGGRLENYNAALQRWSRGANQSVIEQMRTKMASTYGQRLNEIMGGVPVEDYRNTPPVELAVPDATQSFQ